MALLKCDVCGGTLSIDAGGKTATCEFCGAKHSIECMREKVQKIKGSVSTLTSRNFTTQNIRASSCRFNNSYWHFLLDVSEKGIQIMR